MASIKTVLDLDRSKFDQGLDLGVKKFQSAFGNLKVPTGGIGEKISDDINRKLNRSFGAGDAFRGLLMGAGFGSVDKIAEKVSGYWKDAADSAKTILDFSERSLKATLSLLDLRKTDPQRLDDLRKEQRRLTDEMDSHNVGRAVQRGMEYKGEMPATRAAEVDALLKENAVAQSKLQNKIGAEAIRRNEEAGRKERAVLEKADKNWDEWMKAVDEYRTREAEKSRKEEQAAWDRALAEDKRARDEQNFLAERRDLARQTAEQAAGRYRTNKDDFLNLSVDEAAHGAGTGSDRARARLIQYKEKMAGAAFRSNSEFRDESGHVMSGRERGLQLLNQAEKLRDYSRFKSDEKDPYGATEMKAAAADLKKAADDLSHAEVTVEVDP
jgi:hypothetical protein